MQIKVKVFVISNVALLAGDHLHTIYNVGDLNNSRFDCGAMKYTGKMYDMRCDDAKYFICEKPLPE